MGYTLAVFGEASLNKNLIFDSLADHFRFGPPDVEGYYTVTDKTRWEDVDLILVVDTAAGAAALDPLNEWSARTGIPFTLVIRSGVRAPDLTKDAARVVSASDVPERVASMLRDALNNGDEAALAFATEPGNPDEQSLRLFALTDVPTYSLGEGLLLFDVVTEDEETQAPPAEEPAAPAEQPGAEFPGNDEEFIAVLEDRLDHLQLGTDFEIDALRGFVREYGARRGGAPEQTASAAAEQDAPEHIKPTKVKREWLDPADGAWKPIGRGRPRKNVETRETPA